MVKVKNISNGVFRLQGKYIFGPGDTLDVPEDQANHLLETYPERFQVVGTDRMVRGGRNRSQGPAGEMIAREEQGDE